MVSNKTLVAFLIVAMVVSGVGTFVSLQKLGTLAPVQLMGNAATETGSVNLTITTNVSIRFHNSSVGWGSGYATTSSSCMLSTLGANNASCIGFTTVVKGLQLENDGNTNVSIVLASGNGTSAAFISRLCAFTPIYIWNVTDNETGSCATHGGNFSNWTNVNASWSVCDVLLPEDSTDSLQINFNASLDYQCDPGVRNDTITATATEA
jgi:hypothetical protein